MKLDKIKQEVCPHCNSLPIAETKDKQHSNGHWNESRTFECGHKLKFSPNFMAVSTCQFNECPNTPENLEKVKVRADALAKVNAYILKLSCDDDYKDKLKRAVNGYLY